ncbi:Protein of unknown function [Gryllus bimaculatus]|nr:Protein of unknown function [Gryllus bimaculatus]
MPLAGLARAREGRLRERRGRGSWLDGRGDPYLQVRPLARFLAFREFRAPPHRAAQRSGRLFCLLKERIDTAWQVLRFCRALRGGGNSVVVNHSQSVPFGQDHGASLRGRRRRRQRRRTRGGGCGEAGGGEKEEVEERKETEESEERGVVVEREQEKERKEAEEREEVEEREKAEKTEEAEEREERVGVNERESRWRGRRLKRGRGGGEGRNGGERGGIDKMGDGGVGHREGDAMVEEGLADQIDEDWLDSQGTPTMYLRRWIYEGPISWLAKMEIQNLLSVPKEKAYDNLY